MNGCNFTSNFAHHGGAVYWSGANGGLTDSTFINNNASSFGGALYWIGVNGKLSYSIFNTNNADYGAVYWSGANGAVMDSIFTSNTANYDGGAIYWSGANGAVMDSIFTSNTANRYGGGIVLTSSAVNSNLAYSTFINNIANQYGGGISWNVVGHMANCSFVNDKWINSNGKSNGIYANSNLTINGGNGIVDISTSYTISGISIVVLNNETYYYPPDTNINFI